jgi:hypothetical protein
VNEDWLVFSPYLYGKRISWKVLLAMTDESGEPMATLSVCS